jgi:anti-sigma B factor antagonist/stage II sporulation protein AA (anti-sigma F factor antagonist)
MEFSSRRLVDVVLAVPIGKIDHTNAIRLEQAMAPIVNDAAIARSPIVLDFTGAEYNSSIGLRVVMAAPRQMRAGDAAIAVAGLQPVVDEIFGIARFKFVLQIFPSVRDALVALSAPALAAYDGSAA